MEDLKFDEQVLYCPKGWYDKYKERMIKNNVPFKEIILDGKKAFVLPRQYRPHAWKL